MSTPACQRALVLLILAGGGCGWKVGPMADISLSMGNVEGAVVEPGLRAALSSGLSRHLAQRGLRSGPAITLDVQSASLIPQAAVSDVGTVAFRAELSVWARVAERDGCEAHVEVRRLWTAPGQAAESSAARDAAVLWLADEVSVRVVDALSGKLACQ